MGVTVPGTGMAGARAINQMFVHHFLAILFPLLGGILLSTKGKPSCPLLSYSCNFSWQPIKPLKKEMLTLPSGNLRKEREGGKTDHF